MKNIKKVLGFIAVFGLLAVASPVQKVSADANPAGCNASGLQQFPSIVSPAGNAYDGSTITYSVIYVNSDPDSVGPVAPCNVTGANATIDLPGAGPVINVLTGASLPVGTSISCPGGPGCAAGPYTYVVNHADEIGNSVTAIFDILGVLHQDADEEVASDHDTLSKTVVHPSTITSISSSASEVNPGGTVTLTVTEQNDGDTALTNPSVVVNNGVGTLIAPPTSGDTGNDGILGVGETWSWTVVSGVINSNTTFTATGHGQSNGLDVTWCANPQTPPQGVFCDQNEQDSVDVTVIVLPLVVTKTSRTAFERAWDWNITKSVDDDNLLLAEGQSFTVNYTVNVSATSTDTTDASGIITVANPAGNPSATVTGVTDVLSVAGAAAVTCPVTFPHVLAPGTSFQCTYQVSPSVANAVDQTNTATVTTSGLVPGDSDTIPVDFNPPVMIDECITVTDTYSEGPQGVQVCAGDGDNDETFIYATTFGPQGAPGVDVAVACGEMDHLNTASYLTNDDENDTDEIGSANETVHVNVNCFRGCTLTQGYWKTHNDSFTGGAPTDDEWVTLLGASAEDTSFYSSGASWFDVFWTAPKGNAYYNLAHQFMAAKLNISSGASTTPAVDGAIASATTFFTTYTPASFSALGKNSQVRKDVITWAGILGSFNEGTIGPGHCDEQNPIIN